MRKLTLEERIARLEKFIRMNEETYPIMELDSVGMEAHDYLDDTLGNRDRVSHVLIDNLFSKNDAAPAVKRLVNRFLRSHGYTYDERDSVLDGFAAWAEGRPERW